MLKSLRIFISLVLFCANASAALTVVADLGGVPVAPLFEPITTLTDNTGPAPVSPKPLAQAVFPVTSTRLHPGAVASRKIDLPGMTPLFLIGDDARSVRWLKAQQHTLLSLGATGLVVNVASQARFNRLQQQTEGLTLLPVSGDDLAVRLQLDTYPVLITDHGLSQ
ncbi:integrating conjugative element protein [Buttiauxella selenatireducens]|uniref:Integrating conjugative element protein n=1 Tax=Buttiauxella selenatireducens TaxID=3073902 RepID=A0ABY9S4R6_9ENTR|nr:integrating conjugative element protein [Buttiauxella sp. R73]WMY72490.1 integrating conjugative element protein [Buttiauxella sp. R73]